MGVRTRSCNNFLLLFVFAVVADCPASEVPFSRLAVAIGYDSSFWHAWHPSGKTSCVKGTRRQPIPPAICIQFQSVIFNLVQCA